MDGWNEYRCTKVLGMLIVAFIPFLVSCSSEEETIPEDDKHTGTPHDLPIDFRSDAVSRAVDLSTVYDNFCVRALKVNNGGTRSLVIPSYLVRHIDGQWIYSGQTNMDGSPQFLKYWDLSANTYTFAAVTPASTEGSTFSINDDGRFTITLPDLSTNWMIARTIRLGVNNDSKLLDYDDIVEDIADIDKSSGKTSAVFPIPDSSHSDVPLNFHSILTKVVIKAYADNETSFTPLEVGFSNIGIAPATYASATGWTTTTVDYQQLYQEDTLLTSEHNSRETALQLTELYVIPQQMTDATNCSLVQIKVIRDNNDDKVRHLDIPDLWKPNYTYTSPVKFDVKFKDFRLLV